MGFLCAYLKETFEPHFGNAGIDGCENTFSRRISIVFFFYTDVRKGDVAASDAGMPCLSLTRSISMNSSVEFRVYVFGTYGEISELSEETKIWRF